MIFQGKTRTPSNFFKSASLPVGKLGRPSFLVGVFSGRGRPFTPCVRVFCALAASSLVPGAMSSRVAPSSPSHEVFLIILDLEITKPPSLARPHWPHLAELAACVGDMPLARLREGALCQLRSSPSEP